LGLKVSDQNSLLLVGGSLSLDKGGLNALGGRVELAAISGKGQVGLDINGTQLSLDVPDTLPLANISLKDSSTIDTSGGGTVRIYGKDIQITDGSRIFNQVFGASSGGSVIIKATNSLEIIGISSTRGGSSLINTDTLSNATGAGGDIEIQTKNLSLLKGGQISASSLGSGPAGNVTINAAGTVTVGGRTLFAKPMLNSRITFFVGSSIVSSVSSSGEGGDISINAQRLLLPDFAFIETVATTSNRDGRLIPATGKLGDININVDVLKLDYSGIFTSSSLGKASNIIIRAKDIQLSNDSGIFADADKREFQSGGNIFITANKINLRDQSEIISKADLGTGGNTIIQTQTMNIDSGSTVVADNLVLNTFDFAQKRNISTTLVDKSSEIAEECIPSTYQGGSTFALVGRGGVPPSPSEPLEPETVWVEWATLKPAIPPGAKPDIKLQPNSFIPLKAKDAPSIQPPPPPEIVEAQGWIRNAKGEIHLVAAAPGYHHTAPMSPACK
jgi:hypothetical protein